MKDDSTSENAATDIVNLGLSVKNEKTIVYISSLIIRNDKLDIKRKEVNEFIEKQCIFNQLLFLYNRNTNLGTLNKSGIHFNENGTKQLVKKLVLIWVNDAIRSAWIDLLQQQRVLWTCFQACLNISMTDL